jgi:hypothetical protein
VLLDITQKTHNDHIQVWNACFFEILGMSLPPVLGEIDRYDAAFTCIAGYEPAACPVCNCIECVWFLIWYVQAFILSHELSPTKEMDTYLARQLKPLRPMISFGRAAKADPECKTHECVWYWWKDQKIQNPNHSVLTSIAREPAARVK